MKSALTLLMMILALPGSATSVIFPTYSTPVLAGGRIVTISPDGGNLLALSKKGTPVWQHPLTSPSRLFLHRSGKLMLNTGSLVQTVDPGNGSLSKFLTVQPNVGHLTYLEKGNVFWGHKLGTAIPTLAVFDGSDGTQILAEKLGETLAYADASHLILTKCQRKREKGGHSFSQAWIAAFDRSSNKRLWSMKFEKSLDPWHRVVRLGGHFVVEDGTDLVMIAAKTGTSWRTTAEKPEGSLGPLGLNTEDGNLVYVASEMNTSDYNRSKNTLYRLSMPNLQVVATTVMEVIEANSVEFNGDFMITDALYRTACFRTDGIKIWEHFQMHRTPVANGVIYFSDYKDGIARIGTIEVATGNERVLTSEKLKDMEDK